MSDTNSTNFALLGLLKRRPRSAYELTGFMRGSILRAIWPRAESRIYDNVKKLATQGLASVTEHSIGKRKRSVYTITAEGEDELRDWVKQPGTDLEMENEALLKLANAEDLGVEGIRAILDQITSSTTTDARHYIEGLNEIATHIDSENPSSPPVLNVLINSYIGEIIEARLKWLQFAKDYTSEWKSLEQNAEKDSQSFKFYRVRARKLTKKVDSIL